VDNFEGMCAVAEQFQEERERSKMMGLVLGSMALGVLLGYPIGAFLYQLAQKTLPFMLVAVLATFLISNNQLKYAAIFLQNFCSFPGQTVRLGKCRREGEIFTI